MANMLDKSLDDIIKEKQKASNAPRGRPPRSSSGPARRFSNRAANRSAPYSKQQQQQPQPVRAPDTAWQHDMYVDNNAARAPAFPGRGGRVSSIQTGTKLFVSNLDYGVSDEDIKELFSEVGDLKRYTVHYDKSGRSEGTAEVVFARLDDAINAIKRYNNVQLDGKPMKIEMVGTNVATQTAPHPATMFQNQNGAPRSSVRGRGAAIGRPRGGGGGGGRGARRGRGRGRGGGEKLSAEDLDADLVKYHSGAMKEN